MCKIQKGGDGSLNVRMMPFINPAVECILMLGRRFTQISDAPTCVRDQVQQESEKNNLQMQTQAQEVTALAEMEQRLVDRLSAPEETLRLYFSRTETPLNTLAWALYFLDQARIDFSCLSPQQQLTECRHLLRQVLNCSQQATEAVSDLPSLSVFLTAKACSSHIKWAIMHFWCRPAECQAEFRRIMQEATEILLEDRDVITDILSRTAASRQRFCQQPMEQTLEKWSLSRTQDIAVCPSIAEFSSFYVIESLWHPGSYWAFVGVMYQPVQEMIAQVKNSSIYIANGAKALCDRRRVDILKALKSQPLCNQDLSNLLGLSTATISHHMDNLLMNNFVTTTKRGTRVDYSLNSPAIRAYLENALSELP